MDMPKIEMASAMLVDSQNVFVLPEFLRLCASNNVPIAISAPLIT
jgi:hypothetical protein